MFRIFNAKAFITLDSESMHALHKFGESTDETSTARCPLSGAAPLLVGGSYLDTTGQQAFPLEAEKSEYAGIVKEMWSYCN